MNLSNYFFPIEERAVAVHNGKTEPSIFENPLSSPYKAIVRADTNETISIVRDSYKIVENEELVKKLMYELIHLDSPPLCPPCCTIQKRNGFKTSVLTSNSVILASLVKNKKGSQISKKL